MNISIIIPTYNRAHIIQNLFYCLNNQSFNNFEVIIINDGSIDDTVEKIKKIERDYSFHITILNNTHSGRAVCRNTGAMHAKGDLLIFYDDDVRPNPKSVETHHEHHNKNKNTICTGPAFYEIEKLTTDFQQFRAFMEHSWYPKENKISLTAGMPGANWSIKKENFFKIGKLNENLFDSEDFEFSFRATHEFNIPIYFDLNTWVYHDDYKSLSEYIERYILGNMSLTNLFNENNEIRELYYKKLYIRKTTLKSVFFRFFNTKFALKFTETNVFLSIPKKIRYKIYDFIITAKTRYFLNENLNIYKETRC